MAKTGASANLADLMKSSPDRYSVFPCRPEKLTLNRRGFHKTAANSRLFTMWIRQLEFFVKLARHQADTLFMKPAQVAYLGAG